MFIIEIEYTYALIFSVLKLRKEYQRRFILKDGQKIYRYVDIVCCCNNFSWSYWKRRHARKKQKSPCLESMQQVWLSRKWWGLCEEWGGEWGFYWIRSDYSCRDSVYLMAEVSSFILWELKLQIGELIAHLETQGSSLVNQVTRKKPCQVCR